jgi:hypothetical protein
MANVIHLQQEERNHVQSKILRSKMLVTESSLEKDKYIYKGKNCKFKSKFKFKASYLEKLKLNVRL